MCVRHDGESCRLKSFAGSQDMLTHIYKPGQAKNTRLVTGISSGAIVALGCYRLYQILLATDMNIWIQTMVPVIIFVAFGVFIYWALNKPSVADFMIAAEGELKKVNWSTRHEVFVSTVVVIVVVMVLAVLLGAADLFYQLAFRELFKT
jgi:preprotein translocase subunit SecE